LKMDCLTPTKIYVDTFNALKSGLGLNLTGLANITGSGLLNIPRLNEGFDYEVSFLPTPYQLPTFMVEVMERTGLDTTELCHTFNMGLGMVLATDKPELALEILKNRGQTAWVIGQETPGTGEVHIRSK
nr:phosphoribosylformylglycinamidine cyclo-ligase [Bdellovibrionales bacterium]